jgi:hypothetical protein
MSKDTTLLRTVPRHEPAPGRSEERRKLAEAIALAAAAEQALDAARRSVTRAGDAVRRAEGNLSEAGSAIADARSRHLALLSEAATQGVPPTSPAAVREARRREDDAAEEMELCRTAEAELRSRLPALEAAVQRAHNHRVNCVDAVVRSAAERLIAECKAAEAELLRRRALLYFLRRPHVQAGEALHGAVPSPFVGGDHDFALHAERDRPFEEMKSVIDDCLHRPIFAGEANWNRHPSVLQWIAFRKALFDSADVESPTT